MEDASPVAKGVGEVVARLDKGAVAIGSREPLPSLRAIASLLPRARVVREDLVAYDITEGRDEEAIYPFALEFLCHRGNIVVAFHARGLGEPREENGCRKATRYEPAPEVGIYATGGMKGHVGQAKMLVSRDCAR